jgi:hypothetical protein
MFLDRSISAGVDHLDILSGPDLKYNLRGFLQVANLER